MEKLKTAGKLLTVRQDWKKAKLAYLDARDEARASLDKNAWDEKKLRRENNEERGKNLALIGASGVKSNSYDDALFYNDLKTEQEAEFNKKQAAGEAYRSMRKARAEKKAAKLKYSLSLLDTFM
ncbi:MAG TPA: hypothetical protein DD624_05850 [Alphaproteobacteria bacterium]|mgnify:CR=1 FL=1|nr:hypothetical protein [Alphaproteobacteria bacterium]